MDLFGNDPALNLLPCDGVVNYQEHALRLHEELSASTLDIFADARPRGGS